MELNTKLVEEFGRLEKLCNEIYNERSGVTKYINEMISCGISGERYVQHWDYNLSRLKDVRNKRNKLSHGEIPFDFQLTTKEDIEFVVEFKKRIMSLSDPLTIYRKTVGASNRIPQGNHSVNLHPYYKQYLETPHYKSSSNYKKSCFGVALLIAVIAILIFALIIKIF